MRYIDKRPASSARDLLEAQRLQLRTAGQTEWYANFGNDPQTGKSVEKAAVQGQLTPGEQQAFDLIKLLNLNLFALVSLRKKVCNIVFASLQNKSKQQINRMVQNLNRASEKVEFISLQIYFCKRLALSAP